MTEIQKVFEIEGIQARIFTIRGKQVMMDRDLAELYGVETKNLNKAVNRNINRFPASFSFFIDNNEVENLRFQSGTSSLKHGGRRYPVRVFSELGVAMLSAVLRSETAVNVSIQIMEAFVEMRKFLRDNSEILIRLDNVERKHVILQHETDEKFDRIFNALESGDMNLPKQGIFYDGQVFDAYTFVADLIRSAEKSIVLIDNYVDDTVLRMFAKRRNGVSLCIYTKRDSVLALDLAKYKAQYGAIDVKEFKNSHDRFLIIDGREVYHIGASLKDLGNKWFGFSKMEMSAADILRRL